MAAAVVSVSDIVENLTYNKGLHKDSCCKKCFDLETKLQEALKELSSSHLIIELLRNEVTIEKEPTGKQRDSDSVEKKNMHCNPTEKLRIKTKWSTIAAGGSTDKKKEESSSKRVLEPNITSPATDEEWKTVSRGNQKPPAVDHAAYYQIPVIINCYEQLQNSRKEEQVAHGPMKSHEMKTRKDDREKMRKKVNKQEEKKHRIIVIGDSHA